MKIAKTGAVVGLAVVGLLAVSACSSSSSSGSTATGGATGTIACATGSLTAQGSSFQANMQQQWKSDFGKACPGAQVTYTSSGSGAGITAIGNGTADFAGSDVTMTDAQKQAATSACGAAPLTVPVIAGGIAMEYNLSGVNGLRLSADALAGIFGGTITKWNDPKITADNAGVSLPDLTITPVHRSDKSGTTSVFTSFLKANSPSWTLGAGQEIQWPASLQAAKGSDGVTAVVKNSQGGITYAEVSYAVNAGLGVAEVKGAGDFVKLTTESVSAAIGDFTVNPANAANDLGGTLDFKTTKGYPLATVSYTIVCGQYKDAAKGKLVSAYLAYAVSGGQKSAADLDYAPLPADLAAKARTAFTSIVGGGAAPSASAS